MKILISGGHLTPALALIDFIKKNYPQDEIVFVGRLYSQSKLKQLAQEKNEIEKRQLKFIPLTATKTIKSNSLLEKILFPFLLIRSIGSALTIMNQEKPDIFVSFGGYLAIPLAIAAKITHLKIFTHEQTRAVGRANQFIANFADQVAISYPSSQKYFPRVKTFLTGNPIRLTLLETNAPQPNWITGEISKPILLIMGGSQGSQAINQVIQPILPELTKKWTLIHLCGRINIKFNYKQQLEQAKHKLPVAQQQRYFVKEWASEVEMAWIYNHAHFAISRAGANTVMELAMKNIPTIFIPLPNTHQNEQLQNALWLSQLTGTIILPQNQLTPENLTKKLQQLQKKRVQIIQKMRRMTKNSKATAKIYHLLLKLHAS